MESKDLAKKWMNYLPSQIIDFNSHKMRHSLKYLTLLLILSCKDPRKGIPESERNYDPSTFNKGDSTCMTVQDGIYIFNKINADTVAKAIQDATIKYFGNDFSTKPMQDSILVWLSNDFFSSKSYRIGPWSLNVAVDRSRLSCNYNQLYGLERFGIDLFYEIKICLKKLIKNLGSYDYIEEINRINYSMPKNRLRFVSDFNVDITYRPRSAFNTSKKEYYRVTLVDTLDMFTGLADSNFLYR